MLASTPVLNRYSRTLFELALKKSSLPEVALDIQNLRNLFSTLPQLKAFATHPLLNKQEAELLVEKICTLITHPLLKNFIGFLCKKNRLELLASLPNSFMVYYEKYQGIVRGEIKSAVPLSPEQIKNIQNKLINKINAKEVVLVNSLDPKLIAGFQIQIGDLVIEANIKDQIKKLKQSLAT